MAEARGGREESDQLTDRELELCEAFCRGAGIDELRGHPLYRLRSVAARANGSFAELVRLAGDRSGPGRFLDRLRLLEEFTETSAEADPDPEAAAAHELEAERRRLAGELALAEDAARRGDPFAAQDALDLRKRLAGMVP